MTLRIYDFKCVDCGTVNEQLVKKDTTAIECQECSGVAKRMVSAPGMVQTNFADKTGFKTRK